MEARLYDLSRIARDLDNDTEAISEMIRVFLEFTPGTIDELNNAYDSSDYSRLAKIAHKLKYSIYSYGINSIKDDILKIEELASQEASLDKIKPMMDNVNNTLASVISTIKEEIITG